MMSELGAAPKSDSKVLPRSSSFTDAASQNDNIPLVVNADLPRSLHGKNSSAHRSWSSSQAVVRRDSASRTSGGAIAAPISASATFASNLPQPASTIQRGNDIALNIEHHGSNPGAYPDERSWPFADAADVDSDEAAENLLNHARIDVSSMDYSHSGHDSAAPSAVTTPVTNGLNVALGGSASNTAQSVQALLSRLDRGRRTEWDTCVQQFDSWDDEMQVAFVQNLLMRMCHTQHGEINSFLKPMLQRDFISGLTARGLQPVAEMVLSYLDARSLCSAELVCREWRRVTTDGNIWKRIIERRISRDQIWAGLAQKRSWGRWLKGEAKQALERNPNYPFFKYLYFAILQDISNLEKSWLQGRPEIKRLQCRSDVSKGVYCLQYDEDKIISGQRDNTIRIWRRPDLELMRTLTGHTGSVLCLQYNDRYIITGSSDSTVRIWDIESGQQLNSIVHHTEAVLHLRFIDSVLVTCSKDKTIAVWEMASANEVNCRRSLVGHRAAVNVVDLDRRFIVSASGDRTIKVWSTSTCEFVRTLSGHRRGIACLQYRDPYVVSGSSDNTIRIWDVNTGNCIRMLEGHEELVRCLRFDGKRIVSGAYDGKIKIWDFKTAIDTRQPATAICLHTLQEHTGRVFRLQFDEFQIISSSHDDTIVIWDFLKQESTSSGLITNAMAGPGAASAAAARPSDSFLDPNSPVIAGSGPPSYNALANFLNHQPPPPAAAAAAAAAASASLSPSK